MEASSYSIQAAAKRTGLSPHVIRAWERRYGALAPARSQGRHRLYGEAEIERLLVLQRAIRAGHSIGQIAQLPTAELRALIAQQSPRQLSTERERVGPFWSEALEAIDGLDTEKLRNALERGLVSLGHQGLLRQLIAPLAHEVGNRWRAGTLTGAQEHFFTAAVKAFLSSISRQFIAAENAPRILVATPAGQLHELGAVMVAAEAAHSGWNVTYLGPSLPAGEIAGAAERKRVRAVALSVVYPEDDPQLPNELEQIARFLPPATVLLVGGRAAAPHLATLQRAGAIYADTLEEFSEKLDAIRGQPGEAVS